MQRILAVLLLSITLISCVPVDSIEARATTQPQTYPSQGYCVDAPAQNIYRVDVLNVVDAETIDVLVYLGFNITTEQRLRLFGINSWETRGDERPLGLVAKEFVTQRLKDVDLTIRTHGDDDRGKYGRLLATLCDGALDLNQLQVQLGHARVNFY